MANDIQIVINAKDNASKVVRDLKQQTGGLGAALKASLAVASVAAGGFAVALGASVKAAAGFQSTLNMLQAVSGATGEQMAELSKRAKDLGADVSLPATSAADAALAMTELAKAGLSVNDTMAAAKGVLQLAAAGAISEARAAEIASNALNAFKLSGDQATRVADLLAAAANASSGEVTDMADSLAMSAAVFAGAKIPLEELVTAISQMANQGIKGSDAGTSLKQMLLSLQAPTEKSAKALTALGVSIYDAQGTMRPFRDLVDQFSTSMANLTQKEQDRALATIFGSDAVRAARIALLSGVDAFDKMQEAVTKQGAAADLAAARTRGFNGALEAFKSQLETIAISVGTLLLPALTDVAEAAANALGWLQEQDWSGATAALDRLGAKFNEVAGWIMSTAIPALMEFKKELDPEIGLAAANMAQRFSEAFAAITRSSEEGADGTTQAQYQGLEDLKNILRLALNVMQEDWDGAWKNLQDIVSNGLKSIEIEMDFDFNPDRILRSKGAEMAGALVDAIKGLARQAADEMQIVGQQMIAGLLAGLRQTGDQIGESLSSIVSDAVADAKRQLGIQSPSKVFHKIGEQTIQGLIDGVDSMAPKVADRLKDIAETAINAFIDKAHGANLATWQIAEMVKILQEQAVTGESWEDALSELTGHIDELRDGTAALGSVATGTFRDMTTAAQTATSAVTQSVQAVAQAYTMLGAVQRTGSASFTNRVQKINLGSLISGNLSGSTNQGRNNPQDMGPRNLDTLWGAVYSRANAFGMGGRALELQRQGMNPYDALDALASGGQQRQGVGARAIGTPVLNVTVNVAGSIRSDRDLVDVVYDGIQEKVVQNGHIFGVSTG